jgi:hypothetical protein
MVKTKSDAEYYLRHYFVDGDSSSAEITLYNCNPSFRLRGAMEIDLFLPKLV